MSPIVAGFTCFIVAAFLMLSVMSHKYDSLAIKLLTTFSGVPLLAFFCFGFMATFEGAEAEFLVFRVGYCVLFVVVAGAIAVAWRPRRRGRVIT